MTDIFYKNANFLSKKKITAGSITQNAGQDLKFPDRRSPITSNK